MSVAIAILLAVAAQADRFEAVAPGDRVEVTLIHGSEMTGRVTHVSPDRSSILLDVSEMLPDVEGVMRLRSERVTSVRVLSPMTPQRREALGRRRAEARDRLEQSDLQRRERQARERERLRQRHAVLDEAIAERDRLEQQRRQQELERRRLARRLYEAYPEYAGWGERAYARIDDRFRSGGYPPSPEQARFHQDYSLWEAGRIQYLQEFGRPPRPLVTYCAAPVFVIRRPVPIPLAWRNNRWTVVR